MNVMGTVTFHGHLWSPRWLGPRVAEPEPILELEPALDPWWGVLGKSGLRGAIAGAIPLGALVAQTAKDSLIVVPVVASLPFAGLVFGLAAGWLCVIERRQAGS